MDKNTKKEVKGVSYGRISTLGQMTDRDGYIKDDASPRVQKQKCEAYVKNYNAYKGTNYKITDHISDEGFSGGNTNRPGFQKLCELIERRKIRFVVASELSRLSRNVMDFLAFLSLCDQNNVELMVIDLNLNTSDPMGEFVTTVLIAMAAFERKLTGKRVADNAKSRLLTDGKINGTSEILGLDKCPKKRGHFVPNKNELSTVETIFKTYLKVSSKRETLNELKILGVKDKGDKELSLARLNKIFENAEYRYRGQWALNKKNKNLNQDELEPDKRFKLVQLPHGPLIDTELLDSVLYRLKDNYENKKKKAKDHVYLLSTLLKYQDGTSFSGQPAKQRQYRYYYNKQHDIRIRCEELDRVILARLRDYLKKSPILDELLKKAQQERMSSLPTLNKQLRQIESEVAKLDELEHDLQLNLTSSEMPKGRALFEFIEKRLENINRDRKKYDLQKAEIIELKEELLNPLKVDNIKLSMEKLLNGFSKLSDTQKRRMAEQVFDKIVINQDRSVCLHIYDDSRLDNKKALSKRAFITKSSTSGLDGGTCWT